MHKSILNIFGSSFLLLLLFAGCANKDVAQKAYRNGDYETAFAIWKRRADAGYLDASIHLANILYKTGKIRDYASFIRLAQQAYNQGNKKAAFLLEDIYIKQGNLQKAFYWMQKGDLTLSSQRDFQNHLYLVRHFLTSFSDQKYFLETFEKIAQNNPLAAYALAKFYNDPTNPFYAPKRALYFYKIAYASGNIDAGLGLARLYAYQYHDEAQALKILGELVAQKNARAAYEIGNIFYQKMQKSLQSYNHPCITTHFQKPDQFYVKKTTLFKLQELYMQKGVAVWYQKAYDMGYKAAMLRLIAFDIDQKRLGTPNSYSKMTPQEAEDFLLSYPDSSPKPKLLLARLYTAYPTLGKTELAESIYIDYMDQNLTDAEWKLYQLYRIKGTKNYRAQTYLQDLVQRGFKPALITWAYQNLLANKEKRHSYKILLDAAQKGDVNAISYLYTLQSKGIIKDVPIFELLEKACETDPLNSSIDLQFAAYYLKNNKLTQSATIFQYYAQHNNDKAQFHLAQIYKNLCKVNLQTYWLEKAKMHNNRRAQIEYASLVFDGFIDGNIQETVHMLDTYAQEGDILSANILGDAYAEGKGVDFNPKAAIYYYTLAIKNGDGNGYINIASLYEKINIDHRYDNIIENMYLKAISAHAKNAKVLYAQFLVKKGAIKKAKELLLSDLRNPKAKVLLYKITGKNYYLHQGPLTDNGRLLLQYAASIAKKSRKKALLYAFRAHLCNTPSSGKLTYDLMRFINDSKTIKRIYEKAKRYPRCTN
ncbi:tetratricopeptide repeat protein [Nitratiruptor sp. SB155-2]|uniref:tetratricopeptide repeat protein n=1 Tax=Nitratiruptor sp. (strain SB155-2) TaxID=387092 RepID=UPI0001586F89|nr:sel1 repeat family protein [Nitratiruptor sp. SB155-2]BAF69300.1 hypothetical protein NIS_0186 [Nitratiruptor sp. SB155-2]